MDAFINATFGSIIEIILYAIALSDLKGRLVEGSISYLIDLWFSFRTHATPIWQNPQQLTQQPEIPVSAGSLRTGSATAKQLPTYQRALNRTVSTATLTGVLSDGSDNQNIGGPSGSPTQTRQISYACLGSSSKPEPLRETKP
ncbi:hypothetical protein FRC12_009166 [Ceratobasidium sp. 428]|nr:hypothetical protein FRC12_009166 [Ceratobasidium sp. 428]